MRNSTFHIRLLLIVLLSVASVWAWSPTLSSGVDTNGFLQVHFLDVGQGDAIFIETKTGVQVLIDGGANSGILRLLSEVMGTFDRDIDVVVATHPDKDHIGGLVDVLERYAVAKLLVTENQSDSIVAGTFANSIATEGADIIYARRGQIVQLDASTTLEVLFPETNPRDMESNTSSIVLLLRYGESEFLLTGDSPKSIEEYLVLVEGEHLQSDVLKVGHHGSRTSTSELFLDEVQPQYAVISAGENSQYGHPHVEVTDLLFNSGVEVLSTAQRGTITFLSDGSEVWVE